MHLPKFKSIAKALVLALLAFSVGGCTTIKRYSVQSYQGLLPVEDLKYVYVAPE